MIENSTVNQVKQLTIPDRIRFIEIILQSLKQDIWRAQQLKEESRKPRTKPFKVHTFRLGREIHVDRDELYADRV